MLTFFGNTDLTTLRYVSQKLGQIGMNVEHAARNSAPQLAGGANPIQEQLQQSPLLLPHEVEQRLARETERMLVMAAGRKPLILLRAIYDGDPIFAGLFDEFKGNREHEAPGGGDRHQQRGDATLPARGLGPHGGLDGTNMV